MNFARLNTTYWSKTLYNPNETLLDADINDTFTINLLQSMNDWVCTVERLELTTNAIPFFDGEYEDEQITVNGVVEGDLTTLKAYSLQDLITKLNQMANGRVVWEVDAVGFVTIRRRVDVGGDIIIPSSLNHILGLGDGRLPHGTPSMSSKTPRFGIGDQLQHIQLRSNMNLVSDTVGQTKSNIVTDIAVNNNFTANVGGGNNWSYLNRDKLVYTPQQRRWLNFNASSPLQVLRIFAEYVRPDGESRMVKLPRGGIFAIKLGFYQRI